MPEGITQFLAAVPTLAIKNGVLLVGPGPLGNSLCVPVSVARAFNRQLGKLLADFDARPSNIAPACKMCPDHKH